MLTSEQRGRRSGPPVLCLVTVNWAVTPGLPPAPLGGYGGMWVRCECQIVSVISDLHSIWAQGREDRDLPWFLGGRMDGLLGYVQCWLAPH